MNLLIEFLTAHGRGGASEYHRRVVKSLLEHIKTERLNDIKLFAIYDSKAPIAYEDLSEEGLGKQYDITYLDIQKKGLCKIIRDYSIDKFFIACGQIVGSYPEIAEVRCNIVCVTHDLYFEEWCYNAMYDYCDSCRPGIAIEELPLIERIRYVSRRLLEENKKSIKLILKRNIRNGIVELGYMDSVIKMVKANPQTVLIMVSEYSKATMMYDFGIPSDKIKVLYSPERVGTIIQPVHDPKLKELIDSGKKYYLMVSADRDNKNPYKAERAFNHYKDQDANACLVMLGNYRTPLSDRQINLGYLSDSDLVHAMRNCYALLYPTFFEGFGYPPIEAMRYGKPIICSNTTSIPEILGDAPIYFSPFYESAIYEALTKLNDSNYEEYSRRSRARYSFVKERQERDLKSLVALLVSQGQKDGVYGTKAQ